MSQILHGGPLDGHQVRVRHGKDWYVVHTREANLIYRWCPLRGEYIYDSQLEGTAEEACELHLSLNAPS